MKRTYKFFAALAMLFLTLTASANPVDVATASRVAANYVKSTGMSIKLSQGQLTDLSAAAPFSELFIFTGADGNGFVIVSADDCVLPILASSDNSVFALEGMPDHILEWLLGYEDQIRFCRENGIQATPEINRMWGTLLSDNPNPGLLTTISTSVSPLLTTTWSQSPYYNDLCPGSGSSHAVTGCGATAAAQIMKYWNHPTTGFGSHTYISSEFGALTADFGNTTYDWDNMPDDLSSSSTATEVTAVATLMYHVGVAMDMDYGYGSSGAYTTNTASVFNTFFKYENTVQILNESSYSDADWKSLLRAELDATTPRPILYTGQGAGGGHAFVFDGYNTSEQFHVNWGWGGYCDGHYSIGALNPGIGGTGGNAVGQYNSYCQAIIGIQPDYDFQVTDATTVTLLVDNPAHGIVTQSGAGTYTNGTRITVTANAYEGYRFVRWNDGVFTNPRSFTANGGVVSLTAIYEDLSGNTKHYYNTTRGSATWSTSLSDWGMILRKNDLHDVTYLQSVSFLPYEAGDYELRIFQNGYRTPSASATCSVSSAQRNSWVTVYLDTPYAVDTTKDMYVAFHTDTVVSVIFNNYAWSGNTDGQVSIRWNGNYLVSSSFYYKGDFFIGANFVDEFVAPVINLEVSNVAATSASLTWSANPLSTPLSYTVAYGTEDNINNMDTLNVTTCSAALTGLTHFSDYYVYVRANYAGGTSGWVRATFRTPIQPSTDEYVTLTCYADGYRGGNVLGGGTYANGTSVNLVAISHPGYRFVRWIDGNTDSSRTVTAIASITYVAYFEQLFYTVDVTFEGCEGTWRSGSGTFLESSASGYAWGAAFEVSVTPSNSNYHFSHWGDGVTTHPRWVTIMGDVHLTAVFEPNEAKLPADIDVRDRVVVVRTTDPVPVSLYDAMGRCIYTTGATTQSETLIPVSHAGVYLIRIDNSTTQKVVVR